MQLRKPPMTAQAHKNQDQAGRNFEEFRKLLPDLLKSRPGKYALMHDGKIVDFFDTLADAVRFGHEKFGVPNFSVQEITDKDVSLGAYSYALCNIPN
jgi:hypothetical protein